jgi:4-amino-4-deoxy-L-arabinose transferase-like glycosyltransferase
MLINESYLKLIPNLINKYQKKVLFIFLLVLSGFYLFQLSYEIGKEPVKIWDEASSATTSVEMLQNQKYLMLMRDGKPLTYEDTKPPLGIWLKVFSYQLFGINGFAVRFPSLLASIGTMLILVLFSIYYLKNIWIAIILMVVAPSSMGYMGYHVARNGDPDALLVFFVTSYYISYFILLMQYPQKRNKWFILTGLGIVFAYYTKSIAAIAPLGGLFVYSLLNRNFYKLLADYRFYLTGLSVLSIIALYYILREYTTAGFTRETLGVELNLFNKNHFQKHPEFIYYFKYLINAGIYPFIYLFPLGFLVYTRKVDRPFRELIIYSFVAALVFIVTSSLAFTKNEWYIAPVYPLIWLLLCVSVYELFYLIHRIVKKRIIVNLVFLLLASGILWFYIDRFNTIFKANQSFHKYTYEPEREGAFIDEIFRHTKSYKNFTVLTDEHPRQFNFYIKKWKYYDHSLNISHTNVYDINQFKSKTVLVCQKKVKEKFLSMYNIDTLMTNKYCILCNIKNEKKPLPKN